MPSVKKHPKICAVLRAKHVKDGPLTVDDCKKLIGWTVKPDDKDWGKDFVLKDKHGRKIRLANNTKNRPFRLPLANRYANEHLRGKWALNLETIVLSDTGSVLQGQHRLVGFILAEEERQINPGRWGKMPLAYEVLVGFGVASKPEVANTFDLGANRKLDDVIYRHQKFAKELTDKKQRGIAKILAGAIRLVWLRVGGQQVSFAPHFPHSEAIEFYGKHPDILKAVTEIVKLDEGEEGNERLISSLVSPAYASGLMYLMAQAGNWTIATKFWKLFASGEGLTKGSPILTLRNLLVRFEAGSGSKRDELIGAVIKSWLLWSDNKKAQSAKDIKVARKKKDERFILSEFPRIGGIDSELNLPVDLDDHQLLILSVLKQCRKEVGYDYLREETGLQTGTLSNALMAETKSGKENHHSLVARKLVSVIQNQPEEGEGKAPFLFQLTDKGRKQVS